MKKMKCCEYGTRYFKLKKDSLKHRIHFGDKNHVRIGQNFAFWATFYFARFYLKKQFIHMVSCRHFKVSDVV